MLTKLLTAMIKEKSAVVHRHEHKQIGSDLYSANKRVQTPTRRIIDGFLRQSIKDFWEHEKIEGSPKDDLQKKRKA